MGTSFQNRKFVFDDVHIALADYTCSSYITYVIIYEIDTEQSNIVLL